MYSRIHVISPIHSYGYIYLEMLDIGEAMSLYLQLWHVGVGSRDELAAEGARPG